MSVADFCVHKVTIQHDQGKNDYAGGYEHDWVSVYSNIPACIQPRSADERTKWSGLPTMATHRIYFADTSMEFTEFARIVFGTRTFDVIGKRNIDELDRFLTVDVREVR